MALFKNRYILALLSGVLLWLSWYPYGFTFFIFFALVPLFLLSDMLLERKSGFTFWQGVWFSFLVFLIWNVGVTWWIWNSTPPGAIAAMLLNAFFMSCIFGTWHWVKKEKLPKPAVPLAFIAFWCTWEYLHLNWQITWPWLNLGNLFAANPKIVQWYEYTGTFGGTIWILTVNFLIYSYIVSRKNIEKTQRSTNKIFIALIAVMIIPIIISVTIYHTYKIKQENGIDAVIVQQNIDPWTEQYEKSNEELAHLLVATAAQKLTPNTALVVCSESALPQTFEEEQLMNLDLYPDSSFQLFDSLLQQYPQLNLIMGLSTVVVSDSKISATARQDKAAHFYYEFYNTSCLYNRKNMELYHKSRLVPGVERMPYTKLFWFLESLAIDLGGISGSLGVDVKQKAFSANTHQGIIKVGAPICYESIFGEHFSQFVKDGAQLMCVITNDAWWGNTPGYKQHFEMSALRAIETRRYIVRAANTGISAFFDPLGNARQKTEYETRTSISQIVYPNNEVTFYTKHGDYLARILLAIAGGIVLFSIFYSVRKVTSGK